MTRHSTRPIAAEGRTPPDVATLRADQRERRQRIIDSATELMFDVDYDKVQVKDVADHAGVALGTLYRYFHSKDHLFACALLSWSAGFSKGFELSPTGPTVDRVKAVYRRAARAFEKQPRVYGVLIQVQSSSDPFATEVFREFTRNQSGAFAAAVETSRMSDQKRADVISVMSAVLDESLRGWQLGVQPLSHVYTSIDRAAELILGH